MHTMKCITDRQTTKLQSKASKATVYLISPTYTHMYMYVCVTPLGELTQTYIHMYVYVFTYLHHIPHMRRCILMVHKKFDNASMLSMPLCASCKSKLHLHISTLSVKLCASSSLSFRDASGRTDTHVYTYACMCIYILESMCLVFAIFLFLFFVLCVSPQLLLVYCKLKRLGGRRLILLLVRFCVGRNGHLHDLGLLLPECMQMYVCMYVCADINLAVHGFVNLSQDIHACTHVYNSRFANLSARQHPTISLKLYTYIHIQCIHTHTHIHTYIHTHRHTYIHTYIHTYMHTYIHT